MIRDKTFVSIRDIQKSPTRALDGFKIILNNGKMQWIYIPQEEIEEYAEDIQALGSKEYLAMIAEARSGKKVPAKKVWDELGI